MEMKVINLATMSAGGVGVGGSRKLMDGWMDNLVSTEMIENLLIHLLLSVLICHFII